MILKYLKSYIYINVLFSVDGHIINGINYIANAFNLILIEPRAEAWNQHVSH